MKIHYNCIYEQNENVLQRGLANATTVDFSVKSWILPPLGYVY